MTDINRNRIAEKVRKCLALSKSSNPHEAAAALRQAQKMMEKYGLTEEDVGLTAFDTGVVVVRDYEWARRKPIIVNVVIDLIVHAFAVEATWGSTRVGDRAFHSVTYYGPKNRVLLAVHAHEVVYRACGVAWREHLREHEELKQVRGSRAGFYLGWCRAVMEKVAALGVSAEEREATARFKAKTLGDCKLVATKRGQKTVDSRAAAAGAIAAKGFSIHRPVEGRCD